MKHFFFITLVLVCLISCKNEKQEQQQAQIQELEDKIEQQKLEQLQLKEKELQLREEALAEKENQAKTKKNKITMESSGSTCLIKEFYYEGSDIILVVDYVQTKFVEDDFSEGIVIVNQNPKLRYFRVKPKNQFIDIYGDTLKMEEHLKKISENGRVVKNRNVFDDTYDIQVKNGEVQSLRSNFGIQ